MIKQKYGPLFLISAGQGQYGLYRIETVVAGAEG